MQDAGMLFLLQPFLLYSSDGEASLDVALLTTSTKKSSIMKVMSTYGDLHKRIMSLRQTRPLFLINHISTQVNTNP